MGGSAVAAAGVAVSAVQCDWLRAFLVAVTGWRALRRLVSRFEDLPASRGPALPGNGSNAGRLRGPAPARWWLAGATTGDLALKKRTPFVVVRFFGGVSGFAVAAPFEVAATAPAVGGCRLLLHLGGGVCVADQGCDGVPSAAYTEVAFDVGLAVGSCAVRLCPGCGCEVLPWPACMAGNGVAPRRRPYLRFLSVCRRFGFGDWGARVLQYSLT